LVRSEQEDRNNKDRTNTSARVVLALPLILFHPCSPHRLYYRNRRIIRIQASRRSYVSQMQHVVRGILDSFDCNHKERHTTHGDTGIQQDTSTPPKDRPSKKLCWVCCISERQPGAMVIGRFSDATKKVINLTLTFVVFGLLRLTFSGNCRSSVWFLSFVKLEQLLLIPPLRSSLQQPPFFLCNTHRQTPIQD
jgi:hypothetical protein